MDGADLVRELKVALHQLQQSAKPLRSAFPERSDYGELGNLALTSAEPARGLASCRRRHFSSEVGEPLLQGNFADGWPITWVAGGGRLVAPFPEVARVGALPRSRRGLSSMLLAMAPELAAFAAANQLT